MNKILSILLAGVIVPIFAVYLNAKIQDNNPNIKYILSERIPTSFLNRTDAESIQQLDLKNYGKSLANKITVKIKGNVKSYDVLKFSHSDVIKVSSDKNLFEMIYDELPPDGEIKILLKTVGLGITKDNLSITHSKGKATELLENKVSSLNNSLFYGLVSIYIIALILGVRSLLLQDHESDAALEPVKLLKKKQPFYISNAKWFDIRKKAIDKLVKQEDWYGRNVSQQNCYTLLSNGKPAYLDELEWRDLIQKANSELDSLLKKYICGSYFAGNIEGVLTLDKPEYFEIDDWNGAQIKANEKMIANRIENIFKYSLELNSLSYEIKKDMPTGAIKHDWDQYLKILKNIYFGMLMYECSVTRNPIEFLSCKNTELLDDHKRKKLTDFSYKLNLCEIASFHNETGANEFLLKERCSWIDDKDYETIKKRALHTIELKEDLSKNKTIYALLINILNNIRIDVESINGLGSQEKEDLLRVQEEILVRKRENDKKELELSRLIKDTEKIKNKIERQLDFINEFLTDPSVVDRLEDYSNEFAPGNFKNLVEIGRYLKELRTNQANIS